MYEQVCLKRRHSELLLLRYLRTTCGKGDKHPLRGPVRARGMLNKVKLFLLIQAAADIAHGEPVSNRAPSGWFCGFHNEPAIYWPSVEGTSLFDSLILLIFLQAGRSSTVTNNRLYARSGRIVIYPRHVQLLVRVRTGKPDTDFIV